MTGDGTGLATHAGLEWLAETADLTGMTAGFSEAMRGLGGRRHDPGRTLTQVVLALADGATCLADLAVLRNQPAMFGPVASDPTVWRTFDRVGPAEFRRLDIARRDARARAWAAGAGPAGDVIIDIDGTLITTKTDKQDAAPNYKRTYGHHPLLAMIAETGEMLCGIMRPGNAGANNAADHITVLDAAVAQLPDAWAAGHGLGDDPTLIQHRLVIRADAGGANHWLTEEARLRNAEFSIGYSIDQRMRDAIMLCQDDAWVPAINTDGRPRAGAEVIELTGLVNLDAWPERTRLIVRRERPHPGAQLTLFDTIEGRRHTAFITDTAGGDIAGLELRQRQRARAENVIRDTKACGLANLPFDCIVSNDLWMQLCFAANDLLCWARRIGCAGTAMAKAAPKTVRHRFLTVAGRVTPTGRVLHLDQHWPWTTQLLAAIGRIRTAFASLTVTTRISTPTAV
ncbi:MAG: IS1380 family transposase [Acidimicrobiales bacterium]